MVAAPAAADAVARARANPSLRVGLHLVVIEGPAVLSPSEIPGLVDQTGQFPSDQLRLGLNYFFRPDIRRQLEAEIQGSVPRLCRHRAGPRSCERPQAHASASDRGRDDAADRPGVRAEAHSSAGRTARGDGAMRDRGFAGRPGTLPLDAAAALAGAPGRRFSERLLFRAGLERPHDSRPHTSPLASHSGRRQRDLLPSRSPS